MVHLTFKGDTFLEARKLIALVKSNYEDENGDLKAHYDGLYSIPGFMNRSYFCHRCCKGYNTEDSAHHNCQAQNCPDCKRSKSKDEDGCQDFKLWAKPYRSCISCRREFHGEDCLIYHLVQRETEDPTLKRAKNKWEKEYVEELPSIVEMKSVCDQFRKCKDCLVSYKVNEEFDDKCLRAKCKHCLECVNIHDHKFFITSEEEKCFKRKLRQLRHEKQTMEKLAATVVERDRLNDVNLEAIIEQMIEQRKKKVQELKDINKGIPMEEVKRHRNEEALNDLRTNVMEQMVEEGMEICELTWDMMEERVNAIQENQTQDVSDPGKVVVFADVECMIHRTSTIVPMLICYAREDDDTIFHQWGPNCVQKFINILLKWVKNIKEEVHIFFRNLKGFDGISMLDVLYKLYLKVTNIMGTGTKMLHFRHKKLVFKDSLSFLNMLLTNLTNTFGLEQLRKGWFPHKFSKLENLQYGGKIPEFHYYEPQHMDKDKKKSL